MLIIIKKKLLVIKHDDTTDISKRITCSSVDGHLTTFTGKKFDFNNLGDWVFYKGDKMEIHYRGGRINGVPKIISKFGMIINTDLIESFQSDVHRLYVNGKLVRVPEKISYMLPHGGVVTSTGNKIQFKYANEEVDFYVFKKPNKGYYFTSYVRSSSLYVTGLCTNDRIPGKSILRHFKTPILKRAKKVYSCPKRSAFIKFCRKLKIKGAEFNNCVSDLCSKLPKVNIKKIVKIQQEQQKEQEKQQEKTTRTTKTTKNNNNNKNKNNNNKIITTTTTTATIINMVQQDSVH